MSSDFAIALLVLAAAARAVLGLKKEGDRLCEHPVTRRKLSPEEIEHYRQEFGLEEDQVQRLRQGLSINLTGQQHIRLQQRMCEAGRGTNRSDGSTGGWPSEAPDDPATLERARLRAEAEEAESRRRCQQYYEAVSRKKWRGIPEEMRGGLRVDRWGTVFEKNPRGRGWRELGSDDDYEIVPNSSW